MLQKIKQKEEETKQGSHDDKEEEERKETPDIARENRAKRRNLLRYCHEKNTLEYIYINLEYQDTLYC